MADVKQMCMNLCGISVLNHVANISGPGPQVLKIVSLCPGSITSTLGLSSEYSWGHNAALKCAQALTSHKSVKGHVASSDRICVLLLPSVTHTLHGQTG